MEIKFSELILEQLYLSLSISFFPHDNLFVLGKRQIFCVCVKDKTFLRK